MAISGTDWLEVPTIYKVYFSGLNFRESPQNSYGLLHMVRLRTSINWILKISHWFKGHCRFLEAIIQRDPPARGSPGEAGLIRDPPQKIIKSGWSMMIYKPEYQCQIEWCLRQDYQTIIWYFLLNSASVFSPNMPQRELFALSHIHLVSVQSWDSTCLIINVPTQSHGRTPNLSLTLSAKKQFRYVFIQFKPIHIHIHPFKSTIHIASTFHLFN